MNDARRIQNLGDFLYFSLYLVGFDLLGGIDRVDPPLDLILAHQLANSNFDLTLLTFLLSVAALLLLEVLPKFKQFQHIQNKKKLLQREIWKGEKISYFFVSEILKFIEFDPSQKNCTSSYKKKRKKQDFFIIIK